MTTYFMVNETEHLSSWLHPQCKTQILMYKKVVFFKLY